MDSPKAKSKNFEIKVALIGHVSVGKTTILNALFREKYSEVSMKRTTAAINHYRIHQSKSKKRKIDELSEDSTPSIDSLPDSDAAEANSVRSTLETSVQDNASLRNSDEIQERFFDIELAENICQMRDDTSLVVVDIPGINEAGSSNRYHNYVIENWDTFDVAVIVMDAKQGVNTEESVSMLDLAKENMESKRKIPIFVLLNKVDDPDDEEQQMLVEESQKKVEEIFCVSDRRAALETLIDPTNQVRGNLLCPVFIPTSAVHAFIYRTASLMTLDQFKCFDKALVEKLGREEVGKWKWKQMGDEERYKVTHQAVSDPKMYEERLEATNFDKFLQALKFVVGDEDHQRLIIKDQLACTSGKLSGCRGLAKAVGNVYFKTKMLDEEDTSFDAVASFWMEYDAFEDSCIAKLQPTTVHTLSVLMLELQDFFHLANEAPWPLEKAKAQKRMCGLIRRQLQVLLSKVSNVFSDGRQQKISNGSWTTSTVETWKANFRSFLLVSGNEHFYRTFGKEKIYVESAIDKINALKSPVQWNSLTFNVKDSKLRPQNNTAFDFSTGIPDDIANPMHWGHIAWSYCKFMEKIQG